MSYSELEPKISKAGLSLAENPVVVVGVRGYYLETMGNAAGNDRGIYDDAIFLVTPSFFGAYNGNTDPSTRRSGHGFGPSKGMARLMPGVWQVHQFDLHKGKYLALCQRAGDVTVMRDGNPDYLHAGRFGINIHRGGYNTTSSEGCQTIYPAQWDSFITSAQDQAKRHFGEAWKKQIIPYVLLDGA